MHWTSQYQVELKYKLHTTYIHRKYIRNISYFTYLKRMQKFDKTQIILEEGVYISRKEICSCCKNCARRKIYYEFDPHLFAVPNDRQGLILCLSLKINHGENGSETTGQCLAITVIWKAKNRPHVTVWHI